MEHEPIYPAVILPAELPPGNGPFPYHSTTDPQDRLPVFYSILTPADWTRYHQWLRFAGRLSLVDVVAERESVCVEDALSLSPGTWLTDPILHFFTDAWLHMPVDSHAPCVAFFPSFFISLLLNDFHMDPKLEGTFSHQNVKTWGAKKYQSLKKPINHIDTLVFFQNVDQIHWVTYGIFQDLKIIEEFDSMGGGGDKTLKALFRWLSIEYKLAGLELDSSEWILYPTRRSTPRQRNGYDCGVFGILFALHLGYRLNMTNITRRRCPDARCQMLLHLLDQADRELAPEDQVDVERLGNAEADANIRINLMIEAGDGDDNDDDEASAYIEGMPADNRDDSEAENNENNDDQGGNDEGQGDNAGENNNEADQEDAGGNADDDEADDNAANNRDDDDEDEEEEEYEYSDDDAEEEEKDNDDDDDQEEETISEGSADVFPTSPGKTLAALSTSPVFPSSVAAATFGSPLTSPVVDALTPYLSPEVAQAIAQSLYEAEHAEIILPTTADDEPPSLPPSMPSLDHDTPGHVQEEEVGFKGVNSPGGFHDPYSDDDDDLVVAETVDILASISTVPKKTSREAKTKSSRKGKKPTPKKPTSNKAQATSSSKPKKPTPKKPTSNKAQATSSSKPKTTSVPKKTAAAKKKSTVALQPSSPSRTSPRGKKSVVESPTKQPPTTKTPALPTRTSPRGKKSVVDLPTKDPPSPQQTSPGGKKSVLRFPPKPPSLKQPPSPTKTSPRGKRKVKVGKPAVPSTSLKPPPVYPKAASAPSGDGGGGDSDDSESDTDIPLPPNDDDDDDDDMDKKPAARKTRSNPKKELSSREIKGVREGQRLYNISLALQASKNKEEARQDKDKPKFTKPPTKLTDTDAYFNYLEHQTEKRRSDTVKQRSKNVKKVTSAARSSMTPEKIRMIRLEKKRKNMEKRQRFSARRAEKIAEKEEEIRVEEEKHEKKMKATEGARKKATTLWKKHYEAPHIDWKKKGATVSKKRERHLQTLLRKQFKDLRTRDERDEDRDLKAKPRGEMSEQEKYEAEVLEIDSLMYVPADSDRKRRRTVTFMTRGLAPRVKVREHFKGLVKLPGKKGNRIVEDISPEWVEYIFLPVYVELVKKQPRQWWPVVVGEAKKKGKSNFVSPSLSTSIKVKYQQGDWNQCLFKATASALHYCGQTDAASYLSNVAPSVQYLPREQAILSLRDHMIKHVPEIGGVAAFNQHQKRRKTNRLTIDGLIESKTRFLTLVIPRANDGSASHAVVVVDDIIFDATQIWAIKLCKEGLDWICGECGMGDIEMALRFERPVKTKKKYARTMKRNW